MRYAKAWTAAAFLIVTALTGVFADDVVNASEVGTLVTVLIEVGLGVFAVYNVGYTGAVPPSSNPPEQTGDAKPYQSRF